MCLLSRNDWRLHSLQVGKSSQGLFPAEHHPLDMLDCRSILARLWHLGWNPERPSDGYLRERGTRRLGSFTHVDGHVLLLGTSAASEQAAVLPRIPAAQPPYILHIPVASHDHGHHVLPHGGPVPPPTRADCECWFNQQCTAMF